MQTPFRTLALATIFAASTPSLLAVPVLLPNGDFETPGGALWEEGGGPNTTFSYESAGGNSDGYGIMTNNGEGFGVFVANDGAEIPLASLGLTAGESYNFIQDMILLSGDTIGGMKIEFYVGGEQTGNTGDIFAPISGDGSAWAAYSYPVTIPVGTETIKVVPLWGSGSSVGYDNIGVALPFSWQTLPGK